MERLSLGGVNKGVLSAPDIHITLFKVSTPPPGARYIAPETASKNIKIAFEMWPNLNKNPFIQFSVLVTSKEGTVLLLMEDS